MSRSPTTSARPACCRGAPPTWAPSKRTRSPPMPGTMLRPLDAAAALVGWRRRRPGSFDRFIPGPTRSKWRRWHYQRHWAAVMTIGRLAPAYQGRLLLPVLGKVASTRYVDRVLVGIVSGQSAEDFARRAASLAHGFAALTCRVRTGRPGLLGLEFVRRDALAAIIPAPAHPRPDRPAGAAGRPSRGRRPVDHPAARHPPADRRGHRRGERLDHLGPDPRPAARPAPGPGPHPPRRTCRLGPRCWPGTSATTRPPPSTRP